MHADLNTGILILGFLLSYLSNQRDIRSLETRLTSIESRLLVIEGDLRRFYETQGKHEKAIEVIEKKLER